MKCKWDANESTGWIHQKLFIPVPPFFLNWKELVVQNFSFRPFLLFTAFFSPFFSTDGPSGRGRCLFCVERTRLSGVPRSRGFRSGDHWPSRASFARGKTALPRAGARNHARVHQVSFRMTASSIRSSGQSLSLFSRGLAPVPPQSASGFPLPERPMGL